MKDLNIIEYIPQGHKNAISRTDLRLITHLTDRDMREMIAVAPEPVYNTGQGYFRYLDESDLPFMRKYLKAEVRRINAISSRVEKARAEINAVQKGELWQSAECSASKSSSQMHS